MLGVPAHSSGEDSALDVLTGSRQLGDVVGMIDALDVLLDDGAFVQFRGDVVRGCAYELHPAMVRLGVRARTFEAR